jgi:hypothetical protein
MGEFSSFIDRIKAGSSEEPPYYLLEGTECATPLELRHGTVEIDGSKTIVTRMDLGRYIASFLRTPQDFALVIDDVGIGAFLSLLFFERICVKRDDGTWDAKAKDRYIPALYNRRKFYRHAVFSSLCVFNLHGEKGRLYLCQEAHIHPDTMEQIGSRESLILNSSVIELADMLYWDSLSGRVKERTVSYNPIPDGAMRRFVGPGSFTEQYGTVYDFWSMDANSLLALLPPEFDEWVA